jgi:hypothetical protein
LNLVAIEAFRAAACSHFSLCVGRSGRCSRKNCIIHAGPPQTHPYTQAKPKCSPGRGSPVNRLCERPHLNWQTPADSNPNFHSSSSKVYKSTSPSHNFRLPSMTPSQSKTLYPSSSKPLFFHYLPLDPLRTFFEGRCWSYLVAGLVIHLRLLIVHNSNSFLFYPRIRQLDNSTTRQLVSLYLAQDILLLTQVLFLKIVTRQDIAVHLSQKITHVSHFSLYRSLPLRVFPSCNSTSILEQ